ncbi:glycoside hydrolase family 18 protein [Aspergillus flavus]|uniref:chitinase n=1 Tax=Aspergillus flavus TaxID=5059 RepID=A0A5N6GE78_ASPFL|nr:glycoside hydrolase family 18 protein [Aspergillus flavus]
MRVDYVYTQTPNLVFGLHWDPSRSISPKRVVGYYADWTVYKGFAPALLDAESFTHINYAFADVNPFNGTVNFFDRYAAIQKAFPDDDESRAGNNAYGCVKQLFLLKKKYRHLKIMLSIGGWTLSGNITHPASTDQGRKEFAASAVKILQDLGFDGIDVDWEYPIEGTQPNDMVQLLAEIRSALDANSKAHAAGKHFELTVASPAGPEKYTKMNLREMDQYVDWWNLMTYDYSGSWDELARHQANLYRSTCKPQTTAYDTASAVKYYESQGVSPSKIVLGMPLYARRFNNTSGLGRVFKNDGPPDAFVVPYKDLPVRGGNVHNLQQPVASYLYDPATKSLLSYDTPSIARKKARYILQEGLGGAMFWEASGDRTDEDSLVRIVVDALGGSSKLDRKENTLDYPASSYLNVREQFN